MLNININSNLTRRARGNIWQKLLCVLQAVLFNVPVFKNSNWVYEDQRGSRDGPPLESVVANFDGVDDIVDYGFKPVSTDYVSIEYNVKRVNGNFSVVINNADSFKDKIGLLWYTDNQIYAIVGDSTSPAYNTISPITIYNNINTHIRLVYDGTLSGSDKTKIYVNGILQVVTTGVGTIPSQFNAINVNNNYTSGTYSTGFSSCKMSDVIFKDRTGNILHYYRLDDNDGTTIFDSVEGGINGTANNITPATFWTTDNEFTSWQNEVGYSDGTGNQRIPAQVDSNETLTGLDALGNTLENKGRVTYDIKIVESAVYEFDGSSYIKLDSELNIGKNFEITGSLYFDNVSTFNTITSKSSTNILRFSTPINFQFRINGATYNLAINVLSNNTWYDYTIRRDELDIEIEINGGIGSNTLSVGDNIDFVISSLYIREGTLDLGFNGKTNGIEIIDDNIQVLKYKDSEGDGNISYDTSGNENNGTITNITHSTDDKSKPYNLIYGFDLWQNDVTPTDYIRVPFTTSGASIKTDGDIITGYTWVSKNPAGKYHNNAESKLLQYATNLPIQIDASITGNFWTSDGTTPVAKSYSDFSIGNIENIILNGKDPVQDIVSLKANSVTLYPNCYLRVIKLLGKYWNPWGTWEGG